MKKLLVILGVVVVVILLSFHPLETHLKAFFLISQEFPEFPIKPLGLISREPEHSRVELESQNGKIIADFFVPSSPHKNPRPAVVLALGVYAVEENRKAILNFAQTFSRLGYIVFWPRIEDLENGIVAHEEPETFVQSFLYLKSLDSVNKERISFVGFSVGSSLALIAGQDPRISEDLHSLVFFGGYYNIFDYLTSVATETAVIDDKEVAWKPSDWVKQHVQEILNSRNTPELAQLFPASSKEEVISRLKEVPEEKLDELRKLHPAKNLEKVRARVFIIHDKGDSYVHYSESLKLASALGKENSLDFLLVNLFEHVRPQGFSSQNLDELRKLYGFLYRVLGYL